VVVLWADNHIRISSLDCRLHCCELSRKAIGSLIEIWNTNSSARVSKRTVFAENYKRVVDGYFMLDGLFTDFLCAVLDVVNNMG
jgi:hypothetical protein